MADVSVPAFPSSIGDPVYMVSELAKLTPVAGDVLVLKCPPEATYEQVLLILKHINQIAPNGVSVAALDDNFNLMMCNVPEFLAMIEKPGVTH